MRQLDVPTIVIDRHARPGDQWRGRYKSLCLHDPVWYDHLPYIKFPENWPVFSPKDKIADWLEMYTRVMELNYWTSTIATSARYDEDAGEWEVTVDRDGEPVTLRPRQLVLATGVSGHPNRPRSRARTGSGASSSTRPSIPAPTPTPASGRGRRLQQLGVRHLRRAVRGRGRRDDGSALLDPHRQVGDADGGRAQRAVLRAGGRGRGHDRAGRHDLRLAAHTGSCTSSRSRCTPRCASATSEFYDRLEAAGFDHDWGEDESGLFMKYLRRGSGYYIDVGAADLVADGHVKLASGQVDHLTEDAVVLEDGTELAADLVVYATGYGSMNGWAAELISQDVADRVGKVWGLGSDTAKDPGPWEGEQRNMWKPTQQPALWFHGGNLHQSRHYSLYLALQLKARQVGIPTPVYGLQEVHHRS